MTGAAITVWNVVTVSLRQRLIPSELFGRVNSVYRWLGTGASALGALAGGQIAYHVGLRAPYIVAGSVTLVAFALGLTSIVVGVRSVGEVTPEVTPELAADGVQPGQLPVDLTPAPPSMT